MLERPAQNDAVAARKHVPIALQYHIVDIRLRREHGKLTTDRLKLIVGEEFLCTKPRAVHDERFVEREHGEQAIMRPHSMTTRGYYIVYRSNGKNIRVSFVIYSAPFKVLQIDTLPNGSRNRSGYINGIGWSLDRGQKPQIAKGNLRASVRRDADIYYFAHIGDYFRTMNVVGAETFAGHTCYHVRGTTKWGNENNQYFDTRTGRLVGYGFHQWNASGTAREKELTRQIFNDYRTFNGLLIPMRVRAFRGDKLINLYQQTSVRFDDVDDRVFALPPSVAAAAKAA